MRHAVYEDRNLFSQKVKRKNMSLLINEMAVDHKHSRWKVLKRRINKKRFKSVLLIVFATLRPLECFSDKVVQN